MGLDYVIQYRKGYENKTVDALSKCMEEGTSAAMTSLTLEWYLEMVSNYGKGDWTKELIEQLTLDPTSRPGYTQRNGLLRYQKRLVIGDDKSLRKKVLTTLHDSPIEGHLEVQNTYSQIQQLFYWPGLKKAMQEYVKSCDICSRCKHESIHRPGLLQPLPISEQAWFSINMDFVEGLPKSESKDCILIVVNRLTKCAHFSNTSLHRPRGSKGVFGLSGETTWAVSGNCI